MENNSNSSVINTIGSLYVYWPNTGVLDGISMFTTIPKDDEISAPQTTMLDSDENYGGMDYLYLVNLLSVHQTDLSNNTSRPIRRTENGKPPSTLPIGYWV